ncbi:MAG: hypothetical protein V1837_01120 [Candidatus Woesearchaeota archaeon]
MDSESKILSIIKQLGPVTPTQIARELQVQSFMASAMLSSLVDSKRLKISSLKFGSSPLYYLPGQEQLLENFLKYLNEKDRRTVALLKERNILKDSEQEPLTRVSLRQIKDFAIPLEVSHDSETELFWRYYILSSAETEALIKNVLGEKKPKQVLEAEKKPEQHKLVQQKKHEPSSDGFAKKVLDYFAKNDISVIEQSNVRKNSLDFVLSLPTAVGQITYYCQAIDKKRINESDLASAYVKGENRKLPILFLTTGELTKPALLALEKDFKKVAVKKV